MSLLPLFSKTFSCLGDSSYLWKTRSVFHQDTKPILEKLASRYQMRDKLYVYYFAQCVFRYYYLINEYKFDYVIGSRTIQEGLERLENDMDQMSGNKRVWFLFLRFAGIEHRYENTDKPLQYLEQNYKRLEGYEEPGACLYLYDMRR